ncbi:MAG TPA: Flp pilus assembly protein CpaB [Gammaproteobacteria bacterium]|jgi:pilus assembly protein CpaB
MISKKKKSERNALLLAALALLSGIAAAMLGYAYIEKRVAEKSEALAVDRVRIVEAPELLSVVVVQRDLFRGERLEAADLTVLRVPTEGVSASGVLSSPEQAVGRVALQNLYAGEWLIDRKIGDSAQGGDRWNQLLGPGMRAIRVPVDQVTGLLGLLQPDDRVDLIAVFPASDGKSVVSRALEQNVAVLAVGQRRLPQEDENKKVDEAGEKSSSVTLEVTQEQAERIALALELGKVRLVLRNRADTQLLSSNGTRLSELTRSAAAPTAKPRPRHTVQLITGGKISTEEVKR